MKRKWIVTGIVTAILAVALIGAGSIIMNVHREITIQASFYDVSMQINRLDNYAGWYPSDTGGLKLTVVNPSSVILAHRNKPGETMQAITAIPQQDPNQTRVVLESNMRFYPWVASLGKGDPAMNQALLNLKSTMEDPSRRYGFTISLEPVSDSIILTAKLTAPDSAANRVRQKLYTLLRSRTSAGALAGMRSRDYYYVTSAGTADQQTEYAVGFPVKQLSGPEPDLEYLRLPAQGHVVTGLASVSQLGKLAVAMNRYVHDQNLKKVAQPMTRYQLAPDEVLLHPEDTVELIYPVF